MNIPGKSNWIKSSEYDLLFILLPPFFCLLVIALFPNFFQSNNSENEFIWFLLVVCVDVGHVYSTIYRTYLDKETINKNKVLFYLSPILIYIVGVVLHSANALFFWRCMAYLAVFHFIRQQYGFMRLYSRNETKNVLFKRIDTLTIYAATIYPLLYWHLQGKQLFNWFVENDFYYFKHPEIIPVLSVIYWAIIGLYIAKEGYLIFKSKSFNVPKNLLMLGTILSWYFGIIYFKGDLTFTLLNVVSHGIPYYALVWAHGNKRTAPEKAKPNWLTKLFKPKNIVLFIGILIVLAYAEELIWDGFIWKEHFAVFPTTKWFPDITDSKPLMALLVPLFALPQLLHYFIDGFIWKIKKDNFGWTSFLINRSKED